MIVKPAVYPALRLLLALGFDSKAVGEQLPGQQMVELRQTVTKDRPSMLSIDGSGRHVQYLEVVQCSAADGGAVQCRGLKTPALHCTMHISARPSPLMMLRRILMR